MPETITSSSNPLVKQIRSLRQRKGRDETGLFLVEGIHHVGEAIEAGWGIDVLVYSPDQLTSDFARGLVEEQSQRGMRCAAVTPSLFTAIAEKDNPQGILAVVRQQHPGLQETSVEAFRTAVALVSPQDPGNVGTILRTLDATGADVLFLLDGGVDPYHPSCIRASMGTIFWKPIIQTSFDEFGKWVRKNGFQLIGSSAHTTTDTQAFQREAKPVILLLGNEQKGLSKEQLNACDASLALPMRGRVSSLNLAVAAGILLYTIME
jgi:RNA methyltransferase, TrmH family